MAAGVAAVAVLAAGLVLRVALAVPVAVAFLGAGYAALLGFEGGGLDLAAPLLAAALLLVAELAYWSLELRGRVAGEPGTALRRAALLAGLLFLALASGTALLALVDGLAAGGAAVDAVGAAAAIGAVALLLVAARRVR